jgi:hypothetical protein
MMKKTNTPRVPPPAVTPEERYHMINDAAYFRSLKHRQESGCAEDEAQSWCEVEAEIDDVLKKHHAG